MCFCLRLATLFWVCLFAYFCEAHHAVIRGFCSAAGCNAISGLVSWCNVHLITLIGFVSDVSMGCNIVTVGNHCFC